MKKLNPSEFINKKYNRLTIKSSVIVADRPGTFVSCLCDCGSIKNILLRLVINNITKSCGCWRTEALIARRHIKPQLGDVFGKLTIIKENVGYNKSRSRKVLCKCVCGKIKPILLFTLTQKNHPTISCGCERLGKGLSKNPWKTEYNCYKKHSAGSRNLEWAIDRPTFEKLCKSPCHYCGIENSVSTKVGQLRRNGIDRVDNSIGYIVSNCVPCCKLCGIMKLDHSLEDFLEKIKDIYNHLKLGVREKIRTFNV
jgi:hypothetical protein